MLYKPNVIALLNELNALDHESADYESYLTKRQAYVQEIHEVSEDSSSYSSTYLTLPISKIAERLEDWKAGEQILRQEKNARKSQDRKQA